MTNDKIIDPKISAVLVVYLLLRCVQLIYSFFHKSESTFLTSGRGLTLVAAFAMSYLTYKRNPIAAWAMVVFLSLHGISIFLFGIFAVPVTQYLMKSCSIILGGYFVYGGVILFKYIQKGNMKDIDSLTKA